MIGIYSDDDTRIAHGFNGLTINNDAYPVASAAVSHRWDSVTEPHAQDDGLEAYEPRRLSTLIRIDGTVEGDDSLSRSASIALLHDRIEAINEAFDPVRTTDDDTTLYDRGFLPYTFSVPTSDTTNYPTGLIPMEYFVRSVELPVPRISKFEGDIAKFTLMLQAVDPRRYLQTLSTLTLTGSNTLNNSLASYKSWPILTLSMSGAGASNFTIDFLGDAPLPLVLNLSGRSAGQTVEVDFKSRLITVNGTRTQSLWVSGDYAPILPKSFTVTTTNTTGISSAVLGWRRAFV